MEDKPKNTPRIRGKKYQEKKAIIDKTRNYPLDEAIALMQKTSYSKFDGTVELHMLIKKESFSAIVTLPHAAGKQKRIEVADADTLKKLAEGKVDFDMLLATAEMMPKLVPFAKILGPKGLMPNPKNGTLIKDASAVNKFGGNTLTVKTEKKAPLIHTIAGKVSNKPQELEENINAILTAVGKRSIIKAYIKPTMGPSIRLQVN
jgi:large subunit ribosomal protein L1